MSKIKISGSLAVALASANANAVPYTRFDLVKGQLTPGILGASGGGRHDEMLMVWVDTYAADGLVWRTRHELTIELV